MSIEDQLNQRLKDAMRAKDQRTADCVRMLKTKHMERRTSAGFKGPLDDALWLDIVASYQKQMRKSREEFVAVGDRGKDAVEQLDFEIAFCAEFLPRLAGEDEVRAAIKETVARLAVTDPKQAGRVMGEVMKAHKGLFDPDMVKRIVGEVLAGS
jgi:hypothetical protein